MLYGPRALASARILGEVGGSVRVGDGKVSAHRLEDVEIPCQCGFSVGLGGEEFAMVDYASAGKTWGQDSAMEVWMPVKGR